MVASRIDEEYDYIVVGSGAGGGPVAANLANAGFRVLLIEAGGDDEPDDYKVPAFHTQSTEHNDLAWKFYVKHYCKLERRRRDTRNYIDNELVDGKRRSGIFYPRAGTLGGCTAHHAMIFVAPHNSDWDHIADVTGDKSWRAKKMHRYFERLERCCYLRPPYFRRLNSSRHGFNGWLPTSVADATLLLRDSVLLRLFAAAAQTCFETGVWYAPGLWRRFRSACSAFADPNCWWGAGLERRAVSWLTSLLDPNDWRRIKQRSEGLAITPLTIGNGMRAGTRELIRDTALRLPGNLTVATNTLALRVELNADKRATGVEIAEGPHLYRADPHASDGPLTAPRRTIKARNEVILSGGTFNTPQLLMLSGIGPPDELSREDIKIDVQVPLPGVGQNLQDRYEVGVVHRMKEPLKLLRNAQLRRGDPEFAEWENGYGLYTTNGAVAAIIKRSHVGAHDPDLFLCAIPGHFTGYRPGYSAWGRSSTFFTWYVLKGHTDNTAGRVRLQSKEPHDTPCINFRYFDDGNGAWQDDLDGVVSGVEFVRKITQRTASVFDEIVPGPQVRARDELRDFVKDNAWGHHACGTCKIGRADDPMAVLDSDFRVRGTKGLRVVDASVFPRIPGLFILSAVYMIAEKASDAIIADARRR